MLSRRENKYENSPDGLRLAARFIMFLLHKLSVIYLW